MKKELITQYDRAKETLISRFSMPLEKREARETINATLLLLSAEQAKIILKELPAEFQAGLYIESDYLSRKVPMYVTTDFSRISKTHLKKITRQTIGDIGNYNDELANNLRWKYNGLLANNELVNQIEKHGWTANAEKRMLKMGLDKETINLIKQQTTAKKMVQILETQGIKGGLHPNEVSKLLQPHIKSIFGKEGVLIDNTGKMRRQFVIDADGKYKWITKKVTRPYRATIKTYSETISRSSMLSAHRSGRYETLQQSNLVEKYRSIAVMDAATGETDAMMHGQIVSFGDGPPYHPSCYSSDTEVLAENGFKRFSDLDETEKVFSINPETKLIELVKPIRYIKYFYEGEMRHIHNKWFNLVVTPDHSLCYVSDWKHKTRTNPPFTFKPATELSGQDCIPLTGNWHTKEKRKVEINGKKYETKAFFSFLGWYMAEGSTSKRKEGDRYVVGISQQNLKNKHEIYDICVKLFSKVWWGKEKIYISEKSIEFFLYSLGKSYEKHIPFEYKQFGAQYLRLFLDCFLEGDGAERNIKEQNAQKRDPRWIANFKSSKVYYTSSKQLRDDISELILKCGNRPTHLKRMPMQFHEHHNGIYLTTHPTYIINEGHTNFATNQTLKNEIVTNYNDYVFCVELPKYHTLYIKSEGKCCWCGNCRCELRPVWKKKTGLMNHSDNYYESQRNMYFWKKHQLKEYNKTLPKGKKLVNYNFLPADQLKDMPDKTGMRTIRAEML